MERLIETLNAHFGKDNVNPLEKHQNVFQCEKKTSDSITYQIFFIDTSEKWIESDYSQYLENIVIDRYYQTEGFLQWNYYYYFISSKELIQNNTLRKKEIESDENYTRKFVLTEEEFNEWIFLFDNISKISKEEISSDLYSMWVNFLRERKLYFVFNSEQYPNYKKPVEDFINGLSSEDIEDIEFEESTNNFEPILHKINNLELIEFRNYPSMRTFDFGFVNLIYGANAVGKTSFYDAIELVITGDLSYKKTNTKFNIQLTSGANNILKFPTTSSKYKKRDIEWYSSGVNRGNELNGNFNKFNYYNSDAAFQLKMDDANDKNNLEDIIADIALGREVNKLEERIIAFNDRFVDSAKNLSNELMNLKVNLEEKNRIIIELGKLERDPNGYKDQLIDSLKKNYWKTTFSNSDDFIAKLDNEIQTVKNILSNIQSKNIINDKISKENIEKELKELNLKKLYIDRIKDELLIFQKQQQVNLSEIEKQNSILLAIDELLQYYNHAQFSFLIDLEKTIATKDTALINSKEIYQLANSIHLLDYFSKESEKTKTVKQLEVEVKEKIESLNKKKKETEFKINKIEFGIEELSIIVSDIKSKGQIYLNLNPLAEDCPLCNTHFTNNELVEAIQGTQDIFTNSIILISLKEDLLNTTKALEETNTQLEKILDLKKLALAVFTYNGLEKTYVDIQIGCNENAKRLTELTESLIQLKTIQSQLKNSGLTEDNFNMLLNRVNEYFKFNIQTNTELELQKQNLIDNNYKLSDENILLAKEMTNKETQLANSFTSEILNEEQLIRRLNIIQEIENNLKHLEIYLNLPENTSLINILENIFEVESVFENYKKAILEAKQHNQVVEITNKEIEKIISEIDIIEPQYNRATFAHNELTKLLQELSKNQFLSVYITKNKTEIVSIFKLIHSPREFKDIIFRNNKVILMTNEEAERTLSEISSGQRTALALSIFLSLNKKLSKGPNILMFDDPVTFVDDMNVLSFFDYLRELVLKSKRQVFFATANDDLAFLFRKKFEFLEDEFKYFIFERKNEVDY